MRHGRQLLVLITLVLAFSFSFQAQADEKNGSTQGPLNLEGGGGGTCFNCMFHPDPLWCELRGGCSSPGGGGDGGGGGGGFNICNFAGNPNGGGCKACSDSAPFVCTTVSYSAFCNCNQFWTWTPETGGQTSCSASASCIYFWF